MKNNPNVSVPSGVPGYNKFDKSCSHVTTTDWFQLQPVYYAPMIPTESTSIDVDCFCQFAALKEPMFGYARQDVTAFFVPFRTLFLGATEFFTHSLYQGSYINNAPAVTQGTLIQFLMQYTEEVTTGPYDFSLQSDPGAVNRHMYKFTYLGKICYKILQSLGYNLNFDMTSAFWNHQLSALPLLAFSRIFYDYFRNPAYDTDATERIFHRNSQNLTVSEVTTLLANCTHSLYDQNIFTSVTDRPMAPNGTMPRLDMLDPSLPSRPNSQKSQVQGGNSYYDGTPVAISGNASASTPVHFSQTVDTMLHKISDFFKRRQIAGYRTPDLYRAEFGASASDSEYNRSVFIGSMRNPVKVDKVTSTSETDSAYIGSFGGTARSGGSKTFKYQSNEFGCIIILATIKPQAMYFQGRPRYLEHVNYWDFFHGDFDGLGSVAMRADELATGVGIPDNFGGGLNNNPSDVNYAEDNIFGFIPRFYEYKTGYDRVTGDFRLKSKNILLRGWFFGRHFAWYPEDPYGSHNESFDRALDRDQYNDVFAQVKGSGDTNFYDNIYCVYNFRVLSNQRSKKLFDDYDFSDEYHSVKTTLTRGGSRL